MRGFIPDGLRSDPVFPSKNGPAAQANGDKSPRHKFFRGFPGTKKNPPKRVFPKTIIDSLSAAILAMVDHP
ncbi:hypothetical protein ACIOWE_24690 [Pseudomonas sp. NPDC087598]|uniref:hypothetical protein n=1 Tax=Pseudomonas sp. NPDC087598 TaxID=3364440 RepID=UPI00382F7E89